MFYSASRGYFKVKENPSALLRSCSGFQQQLLGTAAISWSTLSTHTRIIECEWARNSLHTRSSDPGLLKRQRSRPRQTAPLALRRDAAQTQNWFLPISTREMKRYARAEKACSIKYILGLRQGRNILRICIEIKL